MLAYTPVTLYVYMIGGCGGAISDPGGGGGCSCLLWRQHQTQTERSGGRSELHVRLLDICLCAVQLPIHYLSLLYLHSLIPLSLPPPRTFLLALCCVILQAPAMWDMYLMRRLLSWSTSPSSVLATVLFSTSTQLWRKSKSR